MINQRQTWCIAIALAFLAAPALGAPSKAQKNDEQRENAAVKEARKEVNAAQDRQRAAAKAVRDAEQALNQAEQQQRRAATELQKTGERLENENAELLGLTTSRSALKAAQAQLDAASRPVLQEVRRTAAVLDAQAALDRERTRLEALRPSGAAADRAELARLTAAVNRLERESLARDSRTQIHQRAVDEAEEAVRKQLAIVQRETSRSPAWQAAERTFEAARRDVSQARQTVEKHQRDLQEAARAVDRAEQTLAKKTAADARDPNNRKGKR